MSSRPAMASRLPQQLTPFVGRQTELAELERRLADPACRLLTLAGPGGIGKTRLLLQLAENTLKLFPGGVSFVELQAVQTPEGLFSAAADALSLALTGQDSPQTQLLRYLENKELLLLLDSFEHLVDGAGLLDSLLQAAPRLKLAVTSREALNLQGEWLYPVGGMPFPREDEEAKSQEEYSALQLFESAARRVRPSFSLIQELGDVIRICQLVEGSPLAIELAASWTRMLGCAEIAAEIAKNIDFLATRQRNVPERHRSMQAVFRHSWEMLTEQQQDVFQRLSVFRGGFERAAAEEVTGAKLPILTALVDKSLLRWRPGGSGQSVFGRYRVHELLRQYAADRLAQSPEELTQTRQGHAQYYAKFLADRFLDLLGRRQIEALEEIAADLENVRAAWAWVTANGDLKAMKQMLPTLDSFFQFQSRYLEGTSLMTQAIEVLAQSANARPLLAEVLVYQGWYLIRLGRFEEAETDLKRSLEIFTADALPLPVGMGIHPLLPLAVLAQIHGDLDQAMDLATEAQAIISRFDDPHNLAVSHYVLASLALAEGDYAAATQHAQEACWLNESVNDRWFLAYCLNEWGRAAEGLASYDEARQHLQASYDIRKEFNDPEGMAVALTHLGHIALAQDKYTEGQEFFEQSVAIYQELNDRGGLASALGGLANTAFHLRQHEAAAQYFITSLNIAADIHFVSLLLGLLLAIGRFLIHVNRIGEGLELVDLVMRHPGSDHRIRQEAEVLFARHESAGRQPLVPSSEPDADLQGGIALAQSTLSSLDLAAAEALSDEGASVTLQTQENALTARELEVLDLMAQGLTNQQIADTLIISVGTVKWYSSEIYSKLYVGNRTHAVARARELKLIA